MQDSLGQELIRLIKNEAINTLLQPIVNIEKRNVYGYEALSRGPSDSSLHGAQILFETAERCGLMSELETLCLKMAARSWSAQGSPLRLFVNVSPTKLMPSEFQLEPLQALMASNGIEPSDIIIEISERYPTADPSEVLKTLSLLKSQGFLVAIDDLGSGYSGLKLWAELKPDFVKIDRHFIRDIHDDLIKREFLRSVVGLSNRLGCKLIAEGVETEAELQVVADLEITLVQGFLFGRPKPMATACLDPLSDKSSQAPLIHEWETAGSLCMNIEPINPATTLQVASERLQHEPGIFALPVVDDGKPLGLLHKWRVLETFSTPYGRSLYEHSPATRIMSADALVVNAKTPLDEVSQQLIEEDAYYLKQHFIVTRNNQYAGLGSTRALLKRMTARKIERARYANPLTLLPGNVPIQKELESRLAGADSFTLIYFDINTFKPLNDVLGYRVGDQVILLLADLLKDSFRSPGDFVGHIGGDDFVVISASTVAIDCARKVQEDFVDNTRRFYPAAMLQKGCVESENRTGQVSSFPLVSLSAGIISTGKCSPWTAEQLSDRASHAKKQAKLSPDFCYIDSPQESNSGLSLSD